HTHTTHSISGVGMTPDGKYTAICKELEQVMHQMLQHPKPDMARLVTRSSLLFVELKSACRASHISVDNCRQQVSACKKQMDSYQLQLQNMLYERDHLVREIQLCRDFTNRELNKIEKDEGEKLLESIDGVQDAKVHQRNLSLLASELKTRGELQEEVRFLGIKGQGLEKSIEDRKSFLEKLPERAKEKEHGTISMQKYLGSKPIKKSREAYRQSLELPRPLYVLLGQLESYCHAFGEKDGTAVSVVASTHHISKEVEKEAAKPHEAIQRSEGKRGKRHYGGEGTPVVVTPDAEHETEQVSIKLLLAPSSQAVQLELRLDGMDGSSASAVYRLRFQYLPLLDIIQVEVASHPWTLLANIVPNDSGQGTPNPSNHYTAGGRDMFFQYPADVPARPFKWAQWLAGIYLPDISPEPPLERSVRAVINSLRSRFRSAACLEAQLKEMTQLRAPAVHASAADLFCMEQGGALARLTQWRQVSEDTGAATASAAATVPWQKVGCRCFEGVMKTSRGLSFALKAEVTPEYPLRAPMFQLSGVEPCSDEQSNDLRTVEAEVNSRYVELVTSDLHSWDHLLAHQLRKLQVLLEMVGFSGSSGGGSALSRAVRGRERRKKFAIDAKRKAFVHR
ncbi:unnamed protein product, partial [Chrysoparadoxa australica]